jgi:hypothetical protein
MIGYPANNGSETMIAFDLLSAEEFSVGSPSEKAPTETGHEFGVVFDERQNDPLIRFVETDMEILSAATEDEIDHEA